MRISAKNRKSLISNHLTLTKSEKEQHLSEGDGDREGVPRRGTRRGGGPFPCQSGITAGPYRVLVAVGTGEATIFYAPPQISENTWLYGDSGWDLLVSGNGQLLAKRPSLSHAEKEEKNLDRANKRARTAFRRCCVRNELLKMLTLTYADAHFDRREVKGDVNALFVRWRLLKGGKRFPYAYFLELHPGGHGLHVHVAVPLRYIDKHWLQNTWGHGIVHYRDPKPLREGDKRERARRLAGYMAKYLSKSIGSDHGAFEHRYEVAQGFSPQLVRTSFPTLLEANQYLLLFKGEQFDQVWASSEDLEWEGVPVWVFRSPGIREGR